MINIKEGNDELDSESKMKEKRMKRKKKLADEFQLLWIK